MSFHNNLLIAFTTLFIIFPCRFSAINNSLYQPPGVDCNFDNSTFCGWKNDNSGRAKFNWTLWSGETGSKGTGPRSDVSGNGKYAYLEATSRQHGDNVRVISPKIQGAKCMSIMYHMYGDSMGSLVIYMKTNSLETVQWVKTGNHPNQWLEASVFLNSSIEYQVVLEGIRGASWRSDIAVDDITFRNGTCKRLVTQTLYAFVKEDPADFKLDRIPAHSGWIYQFTMHTLQTKNSSTDVMYFVYPADTIHCAKSVTQQLSLDELHCFPRDFFFTSLTYQADYKKVFLINRGEKLSYGVVLEDYHNCCGQPIKEYFFASVSLPEPNSCPPGWRDLGKSCFQLHIKPDKIWGDARLTCHNRGGRLAVIENGIKPHILTRFIDEYLESSDYFYVGAYADSDGRWVNIKNQLFSPQSSLWGPLEPSGDGWCADLIFGEGWDSRWNGKGWRINDEACLTKQGFVCQKQKHTSGRSTCDAAWFEAEDSCFRVFAGNIAKTWDKAREFCLQQGGDLAIVDSEIKRKTIASNLTNIDNNFPGIYIRAFIGFRKFGKWHWLGGMNISSRIWHPGYPDVLKSGECGFLAKGSFDWKLAHTSCRYGLGYMCETNERNYISSRPTSHSSQASTTGKSFHAVDGNIASCFTIQGKKGKQVWWSVTLQRRAFVHKIWIINMPECCLAEIPELRVVLRNSEETEKVNCKVYDWNVQKRRLMICEPSIMATNITIFADEAEVLTLCEVLITATDTQDTTHGVLQELWYKIPSGTITSLRADSRFPSHPDVVNILQKFDSPFNFHTSYGQRLTAYLQVPESGNYTFYVACDDVCELWLDTGQVDQFASHNEDEKAGKLLLAKLDQGRWTDHNQWDKFPSLQTSREIWLSKCQLYPMETLMKQSGVNDCASVGMKFPNGTYERPIKEAHLFWVRPGAVSVDFQINSNQRIITINTGQKLAIRATYKYCCRGLLCPRCPIRLYLTFAERKILVQAALALDCQEHNFNSTFDTLLQEGSYKINVSYGMLDSSSHLTEVLREIGEVHISATQVEGCNFSSDFCSWSNQGWKLSAFGKGILARVDGKPVVLESPWIFVNSIYKKTGLCLSFSCLLPTFAGASLSVILVTSSNSSIWSLSGSQGQKWLTGQVSFSPSEDLKVVFVANRKQPSDVYHAEVDNISIASKECERSPPHSLPGFTCKGKNSFQCDNGICVSDDLVCDGDNACVDNSDEKNCICLASQFVCPTGECLAADKLCDSGKDCSDRTDESRCGATCSEDNFSCAGGGCVPWSLTCDREKNCEDGTDEPSICGSSHCPLLNLSCVWSNYTDFSNSGLCVGNEVKCDFEDGLCGMKHDSNVHWRIGSGSTPTKNTGPNYDHSTFLPDGKYIFLEASDYRADEAVVLASSVIGAGKATCLQFWYHMKGKDIGSLNVYIQTNETRTLVWNRTGKQGDNWNFGQVGHKGDSNRYKVILEGVVGNGIYGDIAVDDLFLLDEKECQAIYGNESPGCLFELDHCSWKPSDAWKISKLSPSSFLAKDWQNTLGGFTYFQDCSTPNKAIMCQHGSLKSPRILTGAGWKCLQFWYYLGSRRSTCLQVSLITNETNITLWNSNSDQREVGHWSYARLPIKSTSTPYQVLFEGRKSSRQAIIAVDDIVFQTEKCEPIPWQENSRDYGRNPISTKYFWKLDGSDRNITLEGTASYQTKEGIKSLYLDGRPGYAKIPAIDFRKSDFSIAVRFNIQDAHTGGHLISDWSSPFQFRVFVYGRVVRVVLRRSGNVQYLLQMTSNRYIYPNVWTHLVFVWNRVTRKGNLYLNGMHAGETASTYQGQDIDLNLTNHTTYELGFKKDTKEVLHGFLKDLMVFLRPLTSGEAFTLYSPTKALCPIRSTTSGGCCNFPFVHKDKQHNTCTSVERQDLWCKASSSKQHPTWGYCALSDGCLEFYEGLCGWANSNQGVSPWRQAVKQDMKRSTNQVQSYLRSKGWNPVSGHAKESNYQLDFAVNHTGYVKLTDLPDLVSFTICFWMKTSDTTSAGTPIWYRVRYENKGKYVTAIALVDYRGFYLYVGEVTSKKTRLTANDGKWHHICLVWTSDGGKVSIHNDELTLSGSKFSDGETIPGGGEFIVGLTEDQANQDPKAGQFIGLISYVNIFNNALSSKTIMWMSHGCGENLLNSIIPWSQFINGFVRDVKVQRPALCADNEGYRFIVYSNGTSHPSQKSVFESPLYERSYVGHNVCVRFRYLMYGSGRRFLRLYQQLNLINHTRRLMWAVNESNNTDGIWKYGRLALTSVTKHKVSLEADLGSEPGYIGVRGVHVIPGYCHPFPLRATQECNMNFTASSGFIFSPHYPSYYPPLTRCHWSIDVPTGNNVKLRFLEFQLEDHPSCFNDFIEVYSGQGKTTNFMGRYCGQRFPAFLESSSNLMVITFVSNEKVTMSGLKLHYTSEKADIGKKYCIRYEGCPSSCECNPVSPNRREMVITVKKGRELTAVPGNIPSNAAVILFQRNKISHLPKKEFSDLSSLKYLDLSGNHIFRTERGAFGNRSSLQTLKLGSNFIRALPDGMLDNMKSLQTLDCSSNLIEGISSNIFSTSLTSLITLSFRQNRINRVEKDAFNNTRNLQHLYLQDNLLEGLPDYVFIGLSRLKILYLNDNKIQRLSSNTFSGLSSLQKLNLKNNSLRNLPTDVFNGLHSLKEIHLDEFILCCYAEKAVLGVNCISPKDEFSSCSDLMKNKAVQVCIWILGLTALVGNLFVILMRIIVKEDNKVHSFLLTNLAISDLLMGVYLLIIAIKDVQWQGEYFKHDINWRSGLTCTFTGALSMASSEVSVLMLTVITTDRLICIVFPFKVRRMNRKFAYFVVGGVWIFGTMISIIPTFGFDYFFDKRRNVGFYGKSAVCLPLQLSTERQAGWEYAVGIFIVLNFVSFIYILIAYIVMFFTVKGVSKQARSTNMNRESKMARRMMFIVLTDFLCWMPIIIIGLLSLLGKFHDPEKQAYVWIAVFVLPVNSSLNPILYTFSTPLVRRKVGEQTDSITSFLERTVRRPKRTPVLKGNLLSPLPRRNTVFPSESQTTLASRLSPSPMPSTSTRQLDENPECVGPEMGLKLTETPSVFLDEISISVGFVVACSSNGKDPSLRLIKHFSRTKEDDWRKEAELVKDLKHGTGHPNILKYCWHCTSEGCVLNYKKGRFPRLKKSSFLLCYDFTASTTLDEYLKSNKIVLNLDVLFVVAMDLIYAIQYLEQKGVVHNNITTSSVLIGRGLRVPPITAILGGFGLAQRVSRDFPECIKDGHSVKDILGKNILQFGFVLKELMNNYRDSGEFVELQEVMHLCFEQDPDVRPNASQVRELLEELWYRNDIWDTTSV